MSIQRLIETQGIPTVVVTVEPEETAQARPPRALWARGYIAGHTFGRPNDPALQQLIVTDALDLLVHPRIPGELVERDYTEVAAPEGAPPSA